MNGISNVINNGSVGRICHEASGAWTIIDQLFAKAYLQGQTLQYDEVLTLLPNASLTSAAALDGRTTEDCLFLDVYVPQRIFEHGVIGKQFPVMVHVS